METRSYKVYKFRELPQESQQKAIERFRELNNEDNFYTDEIVDSLKGLFDKCSGITLRDYSLGDYRSHVKINFSQSVVYEMTGKRAIAWLENNLYAGLRIPFKHSKRKEFLKYGEGYRAGQIKPCPFTGVCYDEDYIMALNDSLKAGESLGEAFEGLAHTATKLIESEQEYRNSDKAIIETIEANDYDFTLNGKID